MLTTGVDIIEIDRIGQVVARWGERFLRRVYTEEELAYCRGRLPQLAARFAAKEAAMKALGTGRYGIAWREVQVVRQQGHAPTLQLHGRALERARSLGIERLALSLSHSREYAVAFVVATRERSE
ncbi:MAG: holo-ACP synthase [Dehalococcoidia bacterium]